MSATALGGQVSISREIWSLIEEWMYAVTGNTDVHSEYQWSANTAHHHEECRAPERFERETRLFLEKMVKLAASQPPQSRCNECGAPAIDRLIGGSIVPLCDRCVERR